MTAILNFNRPVRAILGDRGSIQRYADGAIADGVKTVIQVNALPGYVLTPDESGITPDVDANQFGILVYRTCRLFVAPETRPYAYRRRAMGESFGSQRDFMQLIETEIWKMENGTAFDGFQSYYNWLGGMLGLPIWEVMSDVNINAPFQVLTVGRNGITIGNGA